MKNNMSTKNDEEILLEDEEEDLGLNPCMTDTGPSRSQTSVVLSKEAQKRAIVTIPNSHDVHVVASVLGSCQEGRASPSVFVDRPPPQEIVDREGDTQSSSSSESDTDDNEEILVCDTYDDFKSVIDDMMATQSGAGDTQEPSTHHSAAELLFGTDSHVIESLRSSLKNISVQPQDAIVEAGCVVNRLEGTLIVNALKGSELLGEGSILVDKNKSIIGSIQDIIGPVQSPMYVLMDPALLRGEEETVSITPGDVVYSVPSLSRRVLDQEDLRVKGYDADDLEEVEEISDCEFSDDEAEAAYRQSQQEDIQMNMPDGGAKKKRRPRQRQSFPSPSPPPQAPKTVAEFYAARESTPTGTFTTAPTFLPVSFQTHHAN